MEIVGIGTEIVECVRIGRMIQEHGELFLARVFTAKEAILKALGIGAGKGRAWTDLEILHVKGQRPRVHLHGLIKDHAHQQRVSEIHVTLAHCRAYATAYAMALKA